MAETGHLLTMPAPQTFAMAIVLIALVSCKKDPVITPQPAPPVQEPAMTYIDLTGRSISFGQTLSLDFDRDGRRNIWFETEQVADNIYNLVKERYVARTYVYCNLLINDDLNDWNNEANPLQKGSVIPVDTPAGKFWQSLADVNIMRKVTQTQTNAVHWESRWINQGHRFLALQFFQNKKRHTGWIELEADPGHTAWASTKQPSVWSPASPKKPPD